MRREISVVPRVAIFLAGVAAGALTLRRERGGSAAAPDEVKRLVASLEARIAAGETAGETRFAQIEARLEEHSVKLAEIPSTAQIVGAMEQLLSRTMASLDERLMAQAHSIDLLKTTVSQTDSLLERVLESIDSLQTFSETTEVPEDSLLRRPAV
jgi:chromosome segregation ATPase